MKILKINTVIYFIATTFLLLNPFISQSQNSENLIPKDALTVFSINNISLLKKIPLDELINYEFMSEIHSELFDGSTKGKTIKDSGIDFDQKLNVFYGKSEEFEITGITFGIKDKKQLFQVFDDFQKDEIHIKDLEIYSSLFNHLLIKGNSALLLRVDPSYFTLSNITDSIWYARGYGYFYDNQYENMYSYDDYESELITDDDQIEKIEIIGDDLFIKNQLEDTTDNLFELTHKTYWEIKDSVSYVLQNQYFNSIIDEIFVQNINLVNQDSKFASQLLHHSDGIFYLDNSRNFERANGLTQFQLFFPELFNDMKELYTGNIMLGDINLKEKSIEVDFQANYGNDLGSIYEKLNSSKFDKNVLKYIHKNNSGFFTYNIDLKEGYNQAFNTIIPILQQEKDPRVSEKVLYAELMNEFINTDALFDTYKGSMFGTFNGIKKVKTTRIEFFYDEDTFEYGEIEIENEEDMPVFALGFSTNRADIPNKILNHFSRMTSRFKNMGKYWVIEDALLNSIPLYIINKNNLLIFTNDDNLAKNHSDGYGSNALSGKAAKKATKSKFMYGYFDWGIALGDLPREAFNSKQNEVLDAMKNKTGILELTSSKTTKSKTTFNLTYTFEGNFDNSGKYLLDLINSAYVLSR
jgi:hypothetical protein